LAFVDIYPGKRAAKKIHVTRAEILRVMGADVPDKEVEASLGALGFAPFESIKTAARKARSSLHGNAPSPPGAPRSNAKLI